MNAVYIKAKQTGIELTYMQPFWTACKGTNHDHLGNHHRLTHKFHPRNSVSTKTLYAISTIFYNKTATSPFDINICFASSTDHNVVQEEPVQRLFLCSFLMGGWGAKIIRFYNHQCYVREKISTIFVRVVIFDWRVHQLLFLKQSKFSGCMSSPEWITEQTMHQQMHLERQIQVLYLIIRLARSDCTDACGRKNIWSPLVENLMSSINRQKIF